MTVKRTKITDFFSSKKVKGEEIVEEDITKVKIQRLDSEVSSENVSETPSETPKSGPESVPEQNEFAKKYNFNKTEWINSLTDEQKSLLELEIEYLHITWLTFLHKELTKPYFLKLKQFLKTQQSKTIFPPKHQIYSWSHHTPLPEIKCLILGQDPYHNHNQAHGLAFSVLEPTKPPPSLKNIYKTIQTDYPNFEIPKLATGGGNLIKWAKSGVLMLNTCLTVEAHKPNSHSKHGWETFTHKVLDVAINYHLENHNKDQKGFVVMAWGIPAQNTLSKFTNLNKDEFLVIKTFHPSPFSAAKGFFTSQCFKLCNEWLVENGKTAIDWGILDGNSIL